jgi:hypothetical protein
VKALVKQEKLPKRLFRRQETAWIAVSVDRDNIFTEAPTLEEVPGYLSEVWHLMTGETVAPESWELEEDVGDDL